MHLAAHGLTSLGTDPYQNLSKAIGTNGLKIRVQPTTISTINKHVLVGHTFRCKNLMLVTKCNVYKIIGANVSLDSQCHQQ